MLTLNAKLGLVLPGFGQEHPRRIRHDRCTGAAMELSFSSLPFHDDFVAAHFELPTVAWQGEV